MNNKLIVSLFICFSVGVGVGFAVGYVVYEPKSGFAFEKSIQIMGSTAHKEGYNTIVKGEARNIGETLMKTLYIFALQYDADGLLLEMRYHRFEIVWPNESVSFEMSFPTLEGQIFKIFAAGNYPV